MIAVKPLQPTGRLNSLQGEHRLQSFGPRTPLKLTRIQGLNPLVERVASMGLLVGKHAQILKKSGSSVVLKIGHTRLALRLSQDLIIFAEPV